MNGEVIKVLLMFISKPVTFEGLVGFMKALGQYWSEIVDLPREAA